MRFWAQVVCSILVAVPVWAQNTAPHATGPSAIPAPASVGTRRSAVAFTGTRAGSRNAATPGSTAVASDGNGNAGNAAAPSDGITGVPRYRAGFRGPRGTTAASTPAELSVIGDTNGDGIADTTVSLPIPQFRNNVLGIHPGTPIMVRLSQPVDSGHVKNGQMLHGTLVQPVGDAPAGSSVDLTVVASAAAGQMSSAGEISLQVVRINGQNVLSQIITAEGQEGPRLTPDAAPARGTEAKITPDKPLVLPAA